MRIKQDLGTVISAYHTQQSWLSLTGPISAPPTPFPLTRLENKNTFSGSKTAVSGQPISRFNPSPPLVPPIRVATAVFFYDLCKRLTVTSLPRLASASTLLMPSLLPTSQILASTGCLVIGQSLTCSSYQTVLKITQHKNLIRKTVVTAKPPVHTVCLAAFVRSSLKF